MFLLKRRIYVRIASHHSYVDRVHRPISLLV
jgi:hypothetical protein